MHHQEKLSSPDTVTSTVTVGLRESVSPTDSEGTNTVTGGVDFFFFFLVSGHRDRDVSCCTCGTT